MDAHSTSERFVMLSEATVYRIDQSLSDLGTKFYKGVAYGTAVADVTGQEFTNTAAALKPLSVSHLAAIDVGGGYFVAKWKRRGRLGATWRDGVDVPLGEDSEQYSVEVERDGSVISTVTVTSQTATVAAISGDVIRVYMLSSAVGRGFPAEVTVS